MAPPDRATDDGLYWFEVEFSDCQGWCFITTGEAQHLRELTNEWVVQALCNLGAARGWASVKTEACGDQGLMLHHSDAEPRHW
jgi:hypothetical protein